MDLSPLVARLKDQLTGFRQIGCMADIEAADKITITPPAAFVAPLSETRGTALANGAAKQTLVRFVVILVVANRRDATGAAALADLEERRRQVGDAFKAWVPAGALNSPSWQDGRVIRFIDGNLWWGDEFACSTFS